MMTYPLVPKVVFFICLTVLIIFAAFFALFIAVFTGAGNLYVSLIILIAVFLIVVLYLSFFTSVTRKRLAISTTVFFSLAALALTADWGYSAYVDSLKITDRGVDLYNYEPFRDGTAAAELEDEASLSLHDGLPVMDGATALYPVYAAFAQAVYPEDRYDPYDEQGKVLSTQTDAAYDRLIDGEADIIFVAGPSSRQEDRAEALGVEMVFTPIGKEAFVFFVNARNSVDELTIEEIRQIYSGDVTNWQEVGGEDAEIRAFQRPEESGSQTALEKLMEGTPLMEPPEEDVAGGMGTIITETSDYHNYRNALGFSFRYFSSEMVQDGDIKHLEVDGIYPDKEAIRDGSYPLSAEFYAVTAGSDNPHVEDLIEWILSDEGQFLIEQSGYVPVR